MPYPGWSDKRIRIVKAFIQENVQLDDGCWLWLGQRSKYGGITIGGKSHSIHRLAHALWNGPVETLVVRHSCDRPLCCNPKHLSTGTQRENMQDAIRRGRFKKIIPMPHHRVLQREGVRRGAEAGNYKDFEAHSARAKRFWAEGILKPNPKKTHCVHGHDEWVQRPSGRICAACHRIRNRGYARAKRGVM